MAQEPAAEQKTEPTVLMVLTNCNELKNKDGKVIGQTGWYIPEAAHPYAVFSAAGYKMVWASIKGGDSEMDYSSYKNSVLADEPDKECVDFIEILRASDANETEVASDKAVDGLKGTIGRDETGDAKDRLINKVLITTQSLTALQGHESEFDIIFFAGGHGTCWDFYDSNPKHDKPSKKDTRDMHSVAAKIYENEKKPGVVGAVCHGLLALVDLKLSDGTLLVKDKTVCGFTNDEEKAAGQTDNVPLSTEDGLVANGAKWSGAQNWACNAVADQGVVTGQNPQSAGAAAKLCLEELAKRRK